MARGKKPIPPTTQVPTIGTAPVEAILPLKRDDAGGPLPTTVTGQSADVQAAVTDTTTLGTSVAIVPGDTTSTDAPDASLADDLERLRIAKALDDLASWKTVRITSQRNFRRAGMRHPKGATDYPIEIFTEEQLELIDADPDLEVEYI